MSIKLIATGDNHYCKEHKWEALAALTTIAETAEREQPAVVTIAGDLFEKAVKNTADDGFPELIAIILRILDVCPIAAVSGTGTHDILGCYEVLTRLHGKDGHNFVMIQPGKAYFKDSFNDCIHGDYVEGQTNLLILGCPEPTREWILAESEGKSAAEVSADLKAKLAGILLGMGAIRRQYPQIPCLFIYHGAVAGVTMQNGQTVGAADIVIGREDLALVGADYYAMGHIHLAQQIGDLPAYYCGDAYHVSWGELDEKGFNLVTLEEVDVETEDTEFGKGGTVFQAKVQRIPFPGQPPRKKIVIDYPQGIDSSDFKGFQTWIVIRARKEDAAGITFGTETLIEQGALPGSRVTIEPIYTETVRASAIVEQHHLRDKVKVKAEASGETAPAESVLAKADQLEREAEQAGFGGAPHHLRLRKVRVRGHKSHMKRLGAEEVTLDLSKFGPGLIAITGPNGKGKTTLGENCHLLPCEFSEGRDRKGGLKDNFGLRDSAREVWEDDPRTGEQYRALIEIDGANDSGKVECHLFHRPPGAEADVPLAGGKGKMANYLEKVKELVGSRTMLLRSTIWTQEPSDNNPRIRRAKEGQKKEIFSELAISIPYKEYAKNAKGKADALDAEITTERGKIDLLEQQLEALPGIRTDHEQRAEDLRTRRLRLQSIESDGKAAATKVEQLAKALEAQRLVEQTVKGLQEENAKRADSITKAKDWIADYALAVSHKEEAERILAEADRLRVEEAKENERRNGIQKERLRISTEFAGKQKTHSDACRAIEATKGRLETEAARLEGDRRVYQAQYARLNKDLAVPLEENCPTCGQLLPADKRAELVQNRKDIEQKVSEINEKIKQNGLEIAKTGQLLLGCTLPPAPPAPDLPPFDEAPLRRIQADLAALDVETAREELREAQQAAAKTEELNKQIQTAEIAINEAAATITKLEPTIDDHLEAKHGQAKANHEGLQRQYADARAETAKVEEQVNALSIRISELEKQGADLADRKQRLEVKNATLREWRYLEEACGPDGIPALELDALGPSIAAETNQLLAVLKDYEIENHYDAIRFETTRMAGKGAKTHQIEDFTIWCHDTNPDLPEKLQWVDFAVVSPGEAVWLDMAIMNAFGIIRERNSGRRSLTQWRDEGDAALDPISRKAFFSLLQAAHDASGRYQTLVVTHSPEALEMIAQKVDIRELVTKQLEAAA